MARWFFVFLLVVANDSTAFGELILNLPAQINHRVTVQPIVVSNNDGSDTATFMGTSAHEVGIKQNIDLIWGQAGIDVDWLMPNYWNDTFANVGTVLPPQLALSASSSRSCRQVPRRESPGTGNVLSMYFIRIVPGFPLAGDSTPLSPFGVDGLAQFDGPGSTMRVGDSLPGAVFMGEPLGEQLTAKVIAHEIGHNLGLLHSFEAENLMLAMDPTPPQDGINARLNTGQILTAQQSRFLTAIPEPGFLTPALFALVLTALTRRRRIVSIAVARTLV